MSDKKIYKINIYINEIKLTTSEDIPLMYKGEYVTAKDVYIKFLHYVPWNYNKEIYNILNKLEEKYLVKLIHKEFPHIPDKFNRIIEYHSTQNCPAIYKKLIDCTND